MLTERERFLDDPFVVEEIRSMKAAVERRPTRDISAKLHRSPSTLKFRISEINGCRFCYSNADTVYNKLTYKTDDFFSIYVFRFSIA